MRIAVIGAGVAGLGAAYALKDVHEVTLFEKEDRLGGHAHTVDIDYDGERVYVDTGFIVYNRRNYPNFVALLAHLGVGTYMSDMSFGVSDPEGYEWASNGPAGLFAWKRNMTDPGFLCLIGDIIKFSARARADLKQDRVAAATLEEYLAGLRIGEGVIRQYVLPMGAAIWSMSEREMLRYPALAFLRFFDNHRLLHVWRPFWRSVRGGSRAYVSALRRRLGAHVLTGDPVVRVERLGARVSVQCASGRAESFDQAILACHSDQAHQILRGSDAEHAALSRIRYAPNTAYLHRDRALMPVRTNAWGSWNYMRQAGDDRVCVSYYMNKLQKIDPSTPVFVTLNPAKPPRQHLTFGTFNYDHPQFDAAAIAAQSEIERLQGRDRIWFAGAWLGHGFHEDGLSSGLAVALRLGARPAWLPATARLPAAAPALEHLPAAA